MQRYILSRPNSSSASDRTGNRKQWTEHASVKTRWKVAARGWCFSAWFSVWRISFLCSSTPALALNQHVSVWVFTRMHTAWTEGRSAPTAAPPQKKQKTMWSYFRNPFNASYKWPDSLLKHCYILLQRLNMPIFHPLSLTHSHTLPHSSTSIYFSLSYIRVNTNLDTHMHTHAHMAISCQTIAHCQERGVDYYFMALHWLKVDPFPSIPSCPMCRLSVGQRSDRLLMVFLLDPPSSLPPVIGRKL